MHDVMRKRLWRKLEALPEERLYQVLDYIEFLESKYARGRAPAPPVLQRFAERLEDRMRARSIAPRLMRGTVGLLGTAGRVVDGVTDAGRGLLRELDTVVRSADRPSTDTPRAGAGSTKKSGEHAAPQRTLQVGGPKQEAAGTGRHGTHVRGPDNQRRPAVPPGSGAEAAVSPPPDPEAADEPPRPAPRK